MEVIFGVQARDGAIRVEIPDDDISKLRTELEEAFGGNDVNKLFWVTDKDGSTYGIPVDKIAFVQFAGEKKAGRTVGFSSAAS